MVSEERKEELLKVLEAHGKFFGAFDGGKITIKESDDLSSVYAEGCTLKAHAPLWGNKPGKEPLLTVPELRKRLGTAFKFVALHPSGMHVASKEDSIALFYHAKLKLRFFPFFYMMNVPLIFVVDYVETDKGLRIKQFNEYPTKSREEATEKLIGLGWPKDTKFEKRLVLNAKD